MYKFTTTRGVLINLVMFASLGSVFIKSDSDPIFISAFVFVVGLQIIFLLPVAYRKIFKIRNVRIESGQIIYKSIFREKKFNLSNTVISKQKLIGQMFYIIKDGSKTAGTLEENLSAQEIQLLDNLIASNA